MSYPRYRITITVEDRAHVGTYDTGTVLTESRADTSTLAGARALLATCADAVSADLDGAAFAPTERADA